jgi:hypothetical protein
MTISPYGSWIWQNRHRRWIRNAQNNKEPVWLCKKWVRNELNRSGNWFWTSGGSLGLNREYSGEYSSARLTARLGSARIWRAWTPDIFFLGARGLQWQNVQAARVGTSEFVWMKPTLWSDQNVFLTTMKIQIYPKNASFFWRTGLWYQLLLGETTGGGFETLRGDKTHCFISTTKSLQRLNKSYTPSLFLSSVSL